MKRLIMTLNEYHQDLKTEHSKGYRSGIDSMLRILREKNKGLNNDDLFQLILDLDLSPQDRHQLCKLIGVTEPEVTECPF